MSYKSYSELGSPLIGGKNDKGLALRGYDPRAAMMGASIGGQMMHGIRQTQNPMTSNYSQDPNAQMPIARPTQQYPQMRAPPLPRSREMMGPPQALQENYEAYAIPQPLGCDDILAHAMKCAKCAEKLRPQSDCSVYISIIIGLLLLVMILSTRLIDRHS